MGISLKYSIPLADLKKVNGIMGDTFFHKSLAIPLDGDVWKTVLQEGKPFISQWLNGKEPEVLSPDSLDLEVSKMDAEKLEALQMRSEISATISEQAFKKQAESRRPPGSQPSSTFTPHTPPLGPHQEHVRLVDSITFDVPKKPDQPRLDPAPLGAQGSGTAAALYSDSHVLLTSEELTIKTFFWPCGDPISIALTDVVGIVVKSFGDAFGQVALSGFLFAQNFAKRSPSSVPFLVVETRSSVLPSKKLLVAFPCDDDPNKLANLIRSRVSALSK